MLSEGVIKESSSPWMVPTVFVPKKSRELQICVTWMVSTVFVPKKSGELQICVDYRVSIKQSVKDSYPLPLPDEIQGLHDLEWVSISSTAYHLTYQEQQDPSSD